MNCPLEIMCARWRALQSNGVEISFLFFTFCTWKVSFPTWDDTAELISFWFILKRHGLYFQSVKHLTYKSLPFPLRFKKDSQSSEFRWVFLLGKFCCFKIYKKCWIMNYLLQPACAIFFLFLYFLYKCLTYKSCWNMLERVYFYPRVFQFSPACRVAGEATLMILISQTAWIQTGIFPLQLLLSIWCSLSLVCLSHSSSPSHFLSSRHLYLCGRLRCFLLHRLPLCVLLFSFFASHLAYRKVTFKGLTSLSTFSSNLFLKIFTTSCGPGLCYL